MRGALWSVLLLSVACAAPAEPPSAAAAPDIAQLLVEDGREIAEAQCAVCHAIGPYGESPNPAAPVFRGVLSRYRADVLEEELINGIRVAHPMPDFQFNAQSADALIAYLRSVQEAPLQPSPPERGERAG